MTPWKVTAARFATRALTLLVQLRRGAEGDRAAAIPADDVEVLQPLGFRVRPVAPDPDGSLEAFVIEQSNGDRLAVMLVDKAQHAGDVSPEAGGVVVHGLAERSAVVYIRASGDIEITPKGGRRVILAGGEQPYVRGTDYADALGTCLDALVVFLSATNTVLVAAGTFATATGTALAVPFPAVGTAAVTFNTAVTAFTGAVSTMTSAANAFKAQRAQYLSTRITGA